MMERAVEISQTYTPGKKLGETRQVTVDRIPASEVVYEGDTDIQLTFEVASRIETLIERALAANDLAHQRIVYTASDPGVPEEVRPWHQRSDPSPRRQASVSGADVR
jgi:hypothetical protein